MGVAFVGLAALVPIPAADQPAETGFVIVDANSKEQTLKACKFTTGTRHLSWLAPAREDAPKPKPGDGPRTPAGPEALEIRDDASLAPPLVAGFITLVPLDSIKTIVFDDNEVMTVRVLGEKDDAIVSGTTKYRGINKLTVEAEVDKGDLGIAEVKFLGGVPKGIRSIRFPAPKPLAAPGSGRAASVTTTDDKKTAHKVMDLQPLYKFADGERLVPTLMFKKTLKIDLAKITKLRAAAEGKDADGSEFTVTLKDGDEDTFTLLKQATIDGKAAPLQGLVGRIAVGYKLFPPATIKEIQFEEAK